MEQDKMSIDERIALIYANVQKLMKHFKIVRRPKSSTGDTAESEKR